MAEDLENKNSLNKVTKHDLELYDIEKVPDLFNGKILPSIVTKKDEFISAIDAIDDLSDNIDKKKKNLKEYVIRGSTPDSLDVFAKNIKLSELKSGDHIAFFHAGAYSFCSDFLSLKKPQYFLI